MTKERQELFVLADSVGLVLGADFKENISNSNLKKKIEIKKDEIDKGMKSNLEDNLNTTKEHEQEPLTKTVEDSSSVKDDNTTHDDEIKIKRTSPCGNYNTTIVGIKEAAKRTPKVNEDEIKKVLSNNGTTESGWKFEEVE